MYHNLLSDPEDFWWVTRPSTHTRMDHQTRDCGWQSPVDQYSSTSADTSMHTAYRSNLYCHLRHYYFTGTVILGARSTSTVDLVVCLIMASLQLSANPIKPSIHRTHWSSSSLQNHHYYCNHGVTIINLVQSIEILRRSTLSKASGMSRHYEMCSELFATTTWGSVVEWR